MQSLKSSLTGAEASPQKLSDAGTDYSTDGSTAESRPGVRRRSSSVLSATKKVIEKTGYTVSSSNDREIWGEIMEIVKVIAGGTEKDVNFLDCIFCLKKLADKGTRAPQGLPIQLSASSLKRALAYCGHATAVYGALIVATVVNKSKSTRLLKVALTNPRKANVQAFSAYLNLPATNLKHAVWKSADRFHAGYYVAFDDDDQALVVAVRGSFSFKDWETDFIAKPAPFLDGYAHEGMLRAAQILHFNLVDLIESLRKEKPDYRLVVTGHSYGAGVAQLLTFMLREEYPEVQCFSFASPACMNVTLASRGHDFIQSYILEYDVVPRLSVHNIYKLRDEIIDMAQQKKMKRERKKEEKREAKKLKKLKKKDDKKRTCASLFNGRRGSGETKIGEDQVERNDGDSDDDTVTWNRTLRETPDNTTAADGAGSTHGEGQSERTSTEPRSPDKPRRNTEEFTAEDMQLYPGGHIHILCSEKWQSSNLDPHLLHGNIDVVREYLSHISINRRLFAHHQQCLYDKILRMVVHQLDPSLQEHPRYGKKAILGAGPESVAEETALNS